MGQAGLFDEDARVELLEGQVTRMAPVASPLESHRHSIGAGGSARDTTVRPERGCRPALRPRPSALTHARPAGSPSPQAPPSRGGSPSGWWGRADPRASPRSDAGPRRARPTTLATDKARCRVPAGYQTVSTRPLLRMRPSRVTSGSCSESAVATMSLSHGSLSRSRLMPVQASATSVSTG